ncbi:hypothetical protein [Marinibactrum halimedae]|uniref:Uncharacterized protein n=1 Tax=Marinibactrum halimedae TaxID=1444977 RepID=A0AA37WLY4_9GAMM|nr:hypothetical protein [Marinibactrum halimedae]MCD9460646.1 hypothetical protein [Marinibactrum halimedae]GLS24291.1 hypothetical protein GCM10007877_00020 [Marinibactrum halimedae]
MFIRNYFSQISKTVFFSSSIKNQYVINFIILKIILFTITACNSDSNVYQHQYKSGNFQSAQETIVQLIELDGPLKSKHSELSDMTWCGDDLILLPQYPSFTEGRKTGDGFLYRIPKKNILTYLNQIEAGTTPSPIQPEPIAFHPGNLEDNLKEYNGYEAIICGQPSVKDIYLAIETDPFDNASPTYIVHGHWKGDQRIMIDQKPIARIESHSHRNNIGNEALAWVENGLLSFHELNDKDYLESEPVAIWLSANGKLSKKIPMPHLPYRLTGVTTLDKSQRFWGVNYRYEGDSMVAKRTDPIWEQYGQAPSHIHEDNVERLVEFVYIDGEIKRSDTPPIQLSLTQEKGRNWEGIARLNDLGFLLVTDKFPGTYFGFVKKNISKQ